MVALYCHLEILFNNDQSPEREIYIPSRISINGFSFSNEGSSTI
jgi:hypothetical protein